MKFFANMSKRDRNLLMVLLVAVVFYLCYSMVITPSLATAEILQSELASLESDLERAEALMASAGVLEDQATDLKKELAGKYKVFFGDLDQAELLYKLDTLMVGAGIPGKTYTPVPEMRAQVPVESGSYVQESYPLLDLAREIAPELHEEGDFSGGAGTAEGITSDAVPGTDISVGFENASYESIYAFMKAVEQMNKTVVLKNMDLEKREAGLAGQLNFAFYGLPALEEKHQGELKFIPALPKGKGNLVQ